MKYSRLVDVAPEKITNTSLYDFIDEWLGTPYLLGGNTKKGVDCSSFTLNLYTTIYDEFIGRTAQQMYDDNIDQSTSIFLFADPYNLEEGDLVFFNDGSGYHVDTIEHVGVYLKEKKFINATSRNGTTGASGVKISDLNEPFWIRRFRAGGRLIE